MNAPSRRIDTLQAGRAVAALAVVLFHAGYYIEAHVGPVPWPLSALFGQGYLGVDFFFVLSGFIIYVTNVRRREEPRWLSHYVRSRLVRIYPPYLPIGVGVAAAYTLLRSYSDDAGHWQWLTTLTLLPVGRPALPVAWTLVHEVTFYVVMGAALYFRRVAAAAVVSAALIVAAMRLVPLVSIDLEFLFGIFAGWCYLEGKMRRPWMLLLVAAACVVAFLAFGSQDARALFGLGLAALLLPLVRLETEGGLRVPAFLVRMGAESYALYLLHLPILMVGVRVCAALHVPPLAVVAALALAAVAASKLFYRFYERPILRRFERPASGADAQAGGRPLGKPPQAAS